MRLQKQTSPLLLLLIPSLANALASPAAAGSRNEPRAVHSSDDALEPGLAVNVNERRGGVPTRDAPVDGRDGKPHLGPFVETDRGSSASDDTDLPPLDGRPDDYTTVDGERIPDTNDGVMFDKNRDKPQEGTTGTEGGVSEKARTRKAHEERYGERLQTRPEAPKEQPRLPHSEEQKLKDQGKESPYDSEEEEGKTYLGLDKPEDLPEKAQQNDPPLANSANQDYLDIDGNPKTGLPLDDEPEGIIEPLHSFVLSLTMILVSEVGDKTFLVAALMAMKHDRMVVFSAAWGALLVMTVLSAVLGHAVPALIPRGVTSFLAAGLFFVFGAKLLKEGMDMDPNEGVGAEMSEVEQELAEKEKDLSRNGQSSDPYTLEMGLNGRRSRSKGRFPSPPRSPSQSPVRSGRGSQSLQGAFQGISNLCSLLLSPAWVQTFVMTFLGEWGDRSQIATIAMAAGDDYWWVTIGATVGHAICTGAAVIGGRAIAGRVSMKVVTIGGAVAFLIFGVIYFIEAFY